MSIFIYSFALLSSATLFAASGSWNVIGGGEWVNGANWTSNPAYPDLAGLAFLGPVIVAPSTITINNTVAQTIVLSALTSNSVISYTITPGTVGSSIVVEAIGANNGSVELALPVVPNGGNLIVGGNPASTMIFSDQIGSGDATLNSSGQIILSGSSPNLCTIVTLNTGTIYLNKSPNTPSVGSSFTIFEGNIVALATNQFSSTTAVTMQSGTLSFGTSTPGFSQTMGLLVYQGGTINNFGTTLTIDQLTMGSVALSVPLLILSGDVSFSEAAGTAVLSGSIDLNGNPHNFVIANGSAAIDMEVSGVLSNGAITKSDSGTLLLSGNNNYAGGTTVSAGTLQGNSTSLQGNINNGATLVFDQSFPGTYSSLLSGAGALIKEGSSTLTLSNTNTTGNVTVSSGTLSVNGTLGGAGTLTVDSGATLQGTGTITKNSTISGTLAPGNSIGTISLVGTQILASGSILDIELNPTSSDLVNVTGTMEIQPGAILKVEPEFGIYRGPLSYTLIHTTAGISGSFSSVINTLPLFEFSLSMTALDLQLLIDAQFMPFSSLINSGNAGAVARCLDALTDASCSDIASVIATLRFIPSVKELKEALLDLQPSAFTSLAIAQQNGVMYIRNTLYNRLEEKLHLCTSTEPTLTLWTAALYAHASQKNTSQEPGFFTNTPGALFGADAKIANRASLGAGLGYTHTHLHWRQNRGKANLQTAYTTLYAQWTAPRGFVQSAITAGYNFYTTHRQIAFGDDAPINTVARGFHRGFESSAHLKTGLKLLARRADFVPFLNIDYIFSHEEGFQERGARSLDLKIRSKNSDLLSSGFGIDISRCFYSQGDVFVPFIRLGALRETRFHGKKERASFKCGCRMTVKGYYPSRNLATLGAGYLARFEHSSISVIYEGKFNKKYRDNSGYVQYEYRF